MFARWSDWWLATVALAALGCGTGDEGTSAIPPSARTWSTPQTIEDARVSYWFDVAYDPRGNAMLVWDDLDGMVNAKRYDATTQTWSAPQPLDNDNPDDAAAPNLAMDAAGNAIVVWQRQTEEDDRRSVWTSRFDVTEGTWGVAELIVNSELVLAPQVVMDGAGNAVVAFTRSELGASVMTAHFDVVTKAWSAAAPLSRTKGVFAGGPKFALAAGGKGVAVWIDGDPFGKATVWAARYDTKPMTWHDAVAIAAPSDMVQPPQVTINEAGTAVALWVQQEGENFLLWTSRSEAGGGAFSEPARLDLDASGDVAIPRIALDQAGNAMAIWNGYDIDRAYVWAKRYSARDRAWSAAQKLEGVDFEAYASGLSIDAAGNVLVLVTREEASRRSPWAHNYTVADGTWSPPVPLDANATGQSELVEFGLMHDGRALAVWSRERSMVVASELR